MLRTLGKLATAVAFGALLLGAGPAWACEVQGCSCQGKGLKAPQKAEAAKQLKASEGVVGKCSCGNAAECTCKKGDCQCAKCGAEKVRIIESLRGVPDPLKVPCQARRDATAGVFI
ncbi:MAG: hypothetical protein HYZ28_16490 [Myxococcales bacterium]|nr:hypothetical protein [Myxococcales bacterium]